MSNWESITNRIISLIETEGQLPWERPWSILTPINAVSGKAYKGINRLVCSLCPCSDPRFVTFRQAVQLGGSVKRGSTGIPVVFWSFEDREETTTREDNAKRRRFPLSRSYTVFNVEQCEGLNLPELPVREVRLDPMAAATAIVEGFAGGPTIEHGGNIAAYVPLRDTVLMPPPASFQSDDAYWSVTFHELSHSTGHQSRLNRSGVAELIKYGSSTYAFEELVAELSSAFLASEAGIQTRVEQSSAYIAGWLEVLKKDTSMIVRAAGTAQRAADWILGRRDLMSESQ
jgi:antirestriction protein ArdC